MSARFFLCGMLAAWTVVQVALGIFFVLAHRLARQDVEYRLFGLLCFALAVSTAGISYGYSGDPRDTWPQAILISFFGSIAATALNLHFVMRYTRRPEAREVALGGYALSAAFALLLALGEWWVPSSSHLVDSTILGVPIHQVAATPTMVAVGFNVLVVLELGGSIVLLVLAYRAGQREALISAVGGAIVMLTVLNDVLLVSGRITSVYLLPQGFLVYAFAVGSTLLVRYRATAGELEVAATHLREKTEALRHSHAELREIQDELVKKKQLAAVGELAASIAHEVRNPLAVIVNAVAGLRRSQVSDADRATLLGIVDEETARLNRLVTDLLRFARPVTIKRAEVSVAELAKRAGDTTRYEGHARVSVHDESNNQTVWADPGLMRVVFDNLVDNAIQAMSGSGTVEIRITRELVGAEPRLHVEIHDTGHGMDERVRERATDPFFTTRPSGTGLGLSIVGRIVEAHGGELSIESQPTRGTTVNLTFPLGSAESSTATPASRT